MQNKNPLKAAPLLTAGFCLFGSILHHAETVSPASLHHLFVLMRMELHIFPQLLLGLRINNPFIFYIGILHFWNNHFPDQCWVLLLVWNTAFEIIIRFQEETIKLLLTCFCFILWHFMEETLTITNKTFWWKPRFTCWSVGRATLLTWSMLDTIFLLLFPS